MLAVLGDGGLDKQIDARRILLAVDGRELARGAHHELASEIHVDDVLHQLWHDAVDVTHVVRNVLIGLQPIRIALQLIF